MHAYLITAKPSRWQRTIRAARAWTTRLLVSTGLIALGLLVFAIRCLRPIVNVLAAWAVRIELEIGIRTGLPSVGASLGAHVTEAFMNEFRTGWAKPTTERERTAR